MQNMNLKVFSGKTKTADDAMNWLGRFTYYADLGNWSFKQRYGTFKVYLDGPAKFWFRQLSLEDKSDWDSLVYAFKKRYCAGNESAEQRYNNAKQLTDESPVEFLHRLNALAKSAGRDIRDYLPNVREHIHKFQMALNNHKLAELLRICNCKSVRKLEEVLQSWEFGEENKWKKTHSAESKPPKKPSVNMMGKSQMGNRSPLGERSNVICEHCNKPGHDQSRCFKLMTCRFCGLKGHTLAYCREHAKKLLEDQPDSDGAEENSHLN